MADERPLNRAEIRAGAGGPELYIDGERIEQPRSVEWRGLTVIAALDPAIKKASGRDVFHLSVGTRYGKPTDLQVQDAIDEWVPRGMELTEQPSVVNPHVRHFFDAKGLR